MDATNANAFNMRAYTNYYMQKYDDAITDIDMAIKLQPKFASYYDSRGEINFMSQKPKKALQDLSTAIELNPKFRHAYIYRCLVYIQLKKTEKAKEDYEKIVEIPPNYNSESEMHGSELLKEQLSQIGIQPVDSERPKYDSSFSQVIALWTEPKITEGHIPPLKRKYTLELKKAVLYDTTFC
ncbi:MAG: hypothetical protein QM734_02640 [Cyclobacteriaceae bacterium]